MGETMIKLSLIFFAIGSTQAMMQKTNLSSAEIINSKDFQGNTLLMQALLRRDYAMANYYLKDRTLDINVQNNEKKTAFMIFLAVSHQEPLPQDTLELFINNYETDFNLVDKNGKTVFDYLLERKPKSAQILQLMARLVPIGAKSSVTIKEERKSELRNPKTYPNL